MRTRRPAAAGMFYPADADSLKGSIGKCRMHGDGPGDTPGINNIIGTICPHAGYDYSGPVACHSFQAMSAGRPDLFIMVGPNHWGLGCGAATMRDCRWEMPGGIVEVDSDAAAELESACSIIETDFFSHTKEHSLEVQVPMLQEFFAPGFRILPILLIDQDMETALSVGRAIAGVAKTRNAIIIGSSDLTHYEPNERAHEQDGALIDATLGMDVGRFYDVLNERRVSACGYGAMAATMAACKELGAAGGTLLKYATSGDITGERESVVGYCSVAFS